MQKPTLGGASGRLALRKVYEHRKRVALGFLLAVLLHLLLIGLSRRWYFAPLTPPATKVSQISPEDLSRIKERILQNKELPALLEQELRQEFRTKEAPKDAKFMGEFNQTVPEETVAPAQRDAPQQGQSMNQRQVRPRSAQRPDQQTRPAQQTKPLSLADLGAGLKQPPPPPPPADESNSYRRGPNQPHRPRGLKDPNMKQGQDNLLNAVESSYYSFFRRFEEPIIRNWFFNMRTQERALHRELAAQGVRAGAELPCTVEFTINRAGEFLRVAVVQSSGSRIVDDATLAAVKKLQHLPNPPAGLFKGGDTFTYGLRFLVEVQSTPTIQSPELEWY
jgi:TonB family protein